MTNLADWDACDEHETVFPKGGECPKCPKEEVMTKELVYEPLKDPPYDENQERS